MIRGAESNGGAVGSNVHMQAGGGPVQDGVQHAKGLSLGQWSMIVTGLMLLVALFSSARTASAQVAESALGERDGVFYEAGETDPYTGPVTADGRVLGWVRDGKRDGAWSRYAADGQLTGQAVYAAGETVRQRQYFANGELSQDWMFTDSMPDGIARSWNRDGSLHEEMIFRKGRRYGPYVLYDEHGNLLFAASYADGVQEGAAVWYYADGTKQWETHYADGKRTGTWAQFAQNGSLVMESTWKDGVLVARNNLHEDM